MVKTKNEFEYDWGSVIVDFVKKKDLDCGDWADCWDEEYDWTEFDLFLLDTYFDEIVSWGKVRFKTTTIHAYNDLVKYKKHYTNP